MISRTEHDFVASAFLEVGFARLYAGKTPAAETAFRAAVCDAPADAETWGILGEMATGADAAIAYRRALRLDPTRWAWWLAEGEAWRTLGAFEPAIAALRAAVALRPDAAAARLALGLALTAAGTAAAGAAAAGWRDEARAHLREATLLAPDDSDAITALAQAHLDDGDALAAVELAEAGLRRGGDDIRLLTLAGRAWAALGEREKARAVLLRALALDSGDDHGPGDDHGAAAALAGVEAAAGEDLSPGYVRALFDRYAERFDADLLGRLDYQAPRLIAEAIARLAGARGVGGVVGGAVLDLGCGTGLMGVELRARVAQPFHLAGVDLSARMIAKAAARGIYDTLAVGDIVRAMDEAEEAWDLLLAADVLVYIGDLGPVLRAARTALRPGGRLLATVERAQNPEEGYTLGPARRYVHADRYLEEAARAAGLDLVLMEPCAPRRERQAPVPGLLVGLVKS